MARQRLPEGNRRGLCEARRNGAAGFTLVEILVSVSIMGISFVGIFGALSTFMQSGAVVRSVADIDQTLRTYSEGVSAAAYVNCAVPSSYSSVTLPAGYTFAAGPTVKYWNGDNPATFSSSACSSDNGAQQISATVKQTSTGQAQALVIAKNRG